MDLEIEVNDNILNVYYENFECPVIKNSSNALAFWMVWMIHI